MSSESQRLTREPFSLLMRGALATLAVLVVARLVLELVGVPQDISRYISSTVGMLLVGIYVAAVAPLRGGLRRLPATVASGFDHCGMDGRIGHFGDHHCRGSAPLAYAFCRERRLWQLGPLGQACDRAHH